MKKNKYIIGDRFVEKDIDPPRVRLERLTGATRRLKMNKRQGQRSRGVLCL